MSAIALLLSTAGCFPVDDEEGGANANDRSEGGNSGEELLTGAMVLSPPSTAGQTPPYGLMQRNTVSVFVDFENEATVELDYQAERWTFSPVRSVAYAVIDGDLVALALPTLERLWRVPAKKGELNFLQVADDGDSLVIANGSEGLIIDADSGEIRWTFPVGSPEDVAFVPGGTMALVVGQTTWSNHEPATPIVSIDLASGDISTIEIPNCSAPIEVLPDGKRALLSPTWCEEGIESTGDDDWTNPDPVSVIELEGSGLRFNKNLPGFGPVALSDDGARAVAYLDMQRLDPSMFDEPSQIPADDAERFHLMVIDPASLEFSLTPIGETLPRFAMTRDGEGLLVDASVRRPRGEITASAELSLGVDGFEASAEFEAFSTDAPFGYFDLGALTFDAFDSGAALDRFVMPATNSAAFVLAEDNLGGQLHRIDFESRQVVNLDQHLRDIGLLPDGETLVLRIRSDPLEVKDGVRLREEYCLSKDGETCDAQLFFTSRLVYSSTYCSRPQNYHDC